MQNLQLEISVKYKKAPLLIILRAEEDMITHLVGYPINKEFLLLITKYIMKF